MVARTASNGAIPVGSNPHRFLAQLRRRGTIHSYKLERWSVGLFLAGSRSSEEHMEKESTGRVIKFRQWDIVLRKMKQHDDLLIAGVGQHSLLLPIENTDLVHMQFTGLKGKNGIEIYEGDVLRLDKDWQGPSSNGVKVGVVEFRDCSFCLELYDSLPLHLLIPAVVEVIGNIYENPELLK